MTLSWLPFCTPPKNKTRPEVTKAVEAASLLVTGSKSPSTLDIWNRFAAQHNGPSTASLISAGRDLARSIDSGIGAGKSQNLFHATSHFKEVIMGAGALLWISEHIQQQTFTAKEKLTLLFSALGHDYHHDAGKNGPTPLRLEKLAVQGLMPHMADHDVDTHTREAVQLMIYSTDVSRSPDYVNALLRGQTPPPPQGYEILAELATPAHARTAQLAAMLRDADILMLSGITLKTAERAKELLGREWQMEMTPEDHDGFLKFIVAQTNEKGERVVGYSSPAGQFFNPNIGKISASFKTTWRRQKAPTHGGPS